MSLWSDCLAVIDDDMRLTIRRHEDASPDHAGQSILNTPVDSIDRSEDDILVATYEKPELGGTIVYFVERR
jgi:hypothetical protein